MAGNFAGQYFKHQKDGETLCFIIGQGRDGSFIQVINNERVWQHQGLDGICVNEAGIQVDLPEIKGLIRYGKFAPLNSDIMGPFRFLPMQCRHRVYSMAHRLEGSMEVAGKTVDFTGGLGYIEGDSGRSFPKEYIWLHCNAFTEPCSVMVSVADIPFLGAHFPGCICAILYRGQEYRLATYRGVKIDYAGEAGVRLFQGDACLEVVVEGSRALPLKAPKAGNMTETIHESNDAKGRFRFWQGGRLLFDLESDQVSFECRVGD